MVQVRKKLFTAEVQMQKRLTEYASTTADVEEGISDAISPSANAASLSSSPALISPGRSAAGLTGLLSRLERIEGKLDQALREEHKEIDQIYMELADISGRIKATKVEISSLRHPLSAEDKIVDASEQLNAVISATEEATNSIMSSAETLDKFVQDLRVKSLSPDISEQLNEMNGLLIRIFEACNFQDLTGQRITKVVRTLSFIEERVNALMDLWDRRDLEAMPLPPSLAIKDEHLNMHGPADQPHENPTSQADIDALFN